MSIKNPGKIAGAEIINRSKEKLKDMEKDSLILVYLTSNNTWHPR